MCVCVCVCVCVLYTHLPYHNDSIIETDSWINDAGMKDAARRIKMQEGRHKKTSLGHIYLSLYCKGSKGWHVRGCWRPNINFIFWPHCYDRHVVSFFVLLMVGVNSIGAFWGPPRSGCGLPYHISSLTLWESAGNCIGGFRGPPRSGVAFPTTSRL